MPSLEKLEIDDLVFKDFTNLWVRDWEKGAEAVQTSDLENPIYDDTYAGVDFYRGPTWTFEFIIEGSSEIDVLDNLDRVKAVWRDPKYKQAGVTTELAFTVAGRRRIVYGRPRRFAENDQRTSQQGYISVLAEFQLMDPLQYNGAPNDGWDLTRLDSVPPDTRGLEEYLTEDGLTTDLGSGVRDGQLGVVAGTAPTPFRATIYGPISQPGITINGKKYAFDINLSASQRLVIDSRTGEVLLNNSKSQNRAYTMKVPTQLKGVRLPPGKAVEVSFFGIDPTLTAYVYFAVRAAYH